MIPSSEFASFADSAIVSSSRALLTAPDWVESGSNWVGSGSYLSSVPTLLLPAVTPVLVVTGPPEMFFLGLVRDWAGNKKTSVYNKLW